MTSSLVGSEMCIRDRVETCNWVCLGCGEGKNGLHMIDVVLQEEGLRRVTVSYTHLTLPTICSV
eukprot:3863606-Prorocentrum_lima.AAC.1